MENSSSETAAETTKASINSGSFDALKLTNNVTEPHPVLPQPSGKPVTNAAHSHLAQNPNASLDRPGKMRARPFSSMNLTKSLDLAVPQRNDAQKR